MCKKVLIVEESDGWYIFDSENGNTLQEGIGSRAECLKTAEGKGYEVPAMSEKGAFFADMDGNPLYVTKPIKSGSVELEYADEIPCLGFEICPVCKGPAFGRDAGGKNCYYCPSCGKEIDCVPPEEWIGEID
ncbi:MAG: hypothetical protein IMF07_04620 [Proteobacteria bacterium]|nr:hypothetical protein [Pseudomonadota bacterium]